MLARYLIAIALLCCSLLQCACGDDDPLLNIQSRAIQGGGVEYVWAVRQSLLAKLPHCDPAASELPLSPHRAVVAARDFLHTRLPNAKPIDFDVLLRKTGIERNPVVSELWIYDISFTDFDTPERDHLLENVIVLMDGSVVIPIERPTKATK